MEPKQAEDLIETASPIALQPEQAARIVQAIQQREFLNAQIQNAQLQVQNAVLSAALELRIDPSLYDLQAYETNTGWEFRPKQV